MPLLFICDARSGGRLKAVLLLKLVRRLPDIPGQSSNFAGVLLKPANSTAGTIQMKKPGGSTTGLFDRVLLVIQP